MKLNILFTAGIFAVAVAMPAAANQSVYTTTLSGPDEAPPNNSPATGSATVTIDPDLHTMRVQSFSGLTANTTMAHIHCCTATPDTGTAMVATATPTFPNFPLNVKSGSTTLPLT